MSVSERKKIANESVERREKRLLPQREYRKSISTNLTITDEIQKFMLFLEVHCTFVLVVTSCGIDSVVAAEKLRLSNTNAGKYLLNKISVDNIKWICQSCDKNLKTKYHPVQLI